MLDRRPLTAVGTTNKSKVDRWHKALYKEHVWASKLVLYSQFK